MSVSRTVAGSDGRLRCRWCAATPEYEAYHDHEWGFPVADDTRLFEKLCLEGFQSGLSWRTILDKRNSFRRAFDGFDVNKIARYNEAKVDRLLQDESIVRHRGKIEAVINNAKRAIELKAETGTLAAYLWRYESRQANDASQPVPATTAESIALSKDLKKRGWKFVGPTTMYAFMQAMGLVNDHAEDCVFAAEVDKARKGFKRPGQTPS